MKQVLRHFKFKVDDFRKHHDAAIQSFERGLEAAQQRVHQAKLNLDMAKSLQPGDLFVWKTNSHSLTSRSCEGVIHFNFFRNQKACFSFVAGDRELFHRELFHRELFHRELFQRWGLNNFDNNLETDLYKIAEWQRIEAEDLPLYINAEIKTPYFDISMNRSTMYNKQQGDQNENI
jgi:hypothetical protein